MNKRRVVITGLGVVAPTGIGKEAYWEGLKNGTNAVDAITCFDASEYPCKIAAEIKAFPVTDFMDQKHARRINRAAQLGIAASKLAYEDSGLGNDPFKNIPVIIGSSVGGMDVVDREVKKLHLQGPDKVSPFLGSSCFCGSVSGEISVALGLTGWSVTLSNGCVSSTDAIGLAMHLIRAGRFDIAVMGGTESCIHGASIAAFSKMGAMCTTYNDNPKKASRPFNIDRSGFVISEGAWMFILEEESRSIERSAKIYGEVAGYATTCDAFHSTSPDPSGIQAVKAYKAAIEDADLTLGEIDCFHAYGNSTPMNDGYETNNIKKTFGDYAYQLPVTSIKSMLGHQIGACGAAQVAAALMSIQENFVPPTINYENPDPECDLDYVPNVGREMRVDNVMCNTLSFGGKNSVVVIKKFRAL